MAFRYFRVAYKKTIIAASIIIVLLSIFDLPMFNAPTFVENIDDSVYSPSKTFQIITNSPIWNNKSITSKVIRETSFYTKIDDKQPGILVFDIGYNGHNEHVNSAIWQQPVSWNSNQLIGNQYLLEAIRKDGGLWSNKGITLKHDWKGELLSFPETFAKSQPLIVKYGKTIYLHDSDYFSSFLSNYQKGLLEELVGNTMRPNLVRLINVCFLILFIVSNCKHKNKYIGTISLLVLFTSIYVVYIHPKYGDIRMVGEIKNSHENNKFDGVPKKMVYSGFNYVIGDKNTKVLVVKSGNKASVKQEKIVVAEENCVVYYKGKELKVTDIPIGDNNGIKDGRLWLCDGKQYNSKIKIDDVLFIATGSPALQSWKDLLK